MTASMCPGGRGFRAVPLTRFIPAAGVLEALCGTHGRVPTAFLISGLSPAPAPVPPGGAAAFKPEKERQRITILQRVLNPEDPPCQAFVPLGVEAHHVLLDVRTNKIPGVKRYVHICVESPI